MGALLKRGRRTGFAAIEVAAVCGVIALLLAMGFMLYRSMRVAARVSVAESNLAQISTGLELYFLKYNAYPPQGSNLAEVLAPFVEDPKAFTNPLLEETRPGETISNLYKEPTLSEIDRPDEYLTAMVSDDGTTAIVLKTGKKVERRDDLMFDPTASPGDILAALDPTDDTADDAGQDKVLPPGDGDAQEEPGINAAPNEFTEEMPAGVITVKDCFDAQFAVVASNLTWGEGGPPVGITAAVQFRSKEPNRYRNQHSERYREENGAYVADLFGGNPASASDTETHIVRNQESFTLEATASYGDWHATYSSEADTDQVLTLRNGDLPPEFDPYKHPVAVGSAISGMIDPATGTVTIGNNQVLYLFEFGTRDRSHQGFDLQDLVVLVTLAAPADASQCEDPPEPVEPPPAPDPEPEPQPEEPDEGFDVADGGETVTKMCSDVRIKAIGSQFGYADGTMVDIVAQANIGGAGWVPLYGGQPINGGEEFTQATVPAGTAIVLKGEISGSYERWLWTRYGYPLGYTSTNSSGQVLTLRRGDTPVRFQPGFPNQAAVGDLLAPYVDPQIGVVSIADNEALYLWDFNPLATNYGIDYQDLIILATAVAAERECEGEEQPGSEPVADPARPVLVLAPTGLETTQATFTIQVSNTATQAKDEAKNVQLNAQVVQGEQYVNAVACTSSLGKVASGETRNVSVTVQTRASWETAYGQQIKICVRILNEDNWPEENENKSVTATIKGPEAPHPVLAITPWGTHSANDASGDAAPGGSASTTARQYAFKIANTASGANPAANVRVAFSVLGGEQYVNQIAYDGDLGTIDAGGCKYCSVRFSPKSSTWSSASAGTQVRLRVSVVQETNDPNANIGKLAEVVIVKGSTIGGSLNINPNNSNDFEFLLTKPDGSTISRDNLLANGRLSYQGAATQVRVRPKGNGNQNTMTVDGASYSVKNGTVYTILSASMTVNLYNSKKSKSMGQWWIQISATEAIILTE